jgi:hypothetical protein
MHGSVSVRYAPIKSKRKGRIDGESGSMARPVGQVSKPFVHDSFDVVDRLHNREELWIAKLKHVALQISLKSICRILMAVPPTHRPGKQASLQTVIERRIKPCRAFVIDPAEVVQMLLAHQAFHPSGQDRFQPCAATSFADALVCILSRTRPCSEYLLPLAECPHAHHIVKRASAVELHSMSLRAAARWILSQSYISIDVPAVHLVTAMCDASALHIDYEQSGHLTYLNLHSPESSKIAHLFDVPNLSENVSDHSKVGMEILDKSGKTLGLVKEDIGVMVRAAQSGEILLKSDVKFQCEQSNHRAEAYSRFQRIAYLNKTFGKGIRGEIFGKVRHRRKKGVRKLRRDCSRLYSQEPKNTSARPLIEVGRDRHAADAANTRRIRKTWRRNTCAARSESRFDKRFTFFDLHNGYDMRQESKEGYHHHASGWDAEWLAKWAVEQDLEYWYKHATRRHCCRTA